MQVISLYWFAAQQQASTLRRQKTGLLYVKFNAEINELSLFFKKKKKATESGQKMAKTKVVCKNDNFNRLEAKG